VGLLAPCALTLGYIGYRSPGVAMSHTGALFGSLQLFALEGSVSPQGTPWTLNVARFLAPLTVVYATVVAVLAILRDEMQRALVAAFARDHVVVVGLGRSGALLASSLRSSGEQVVVVEADASNERITAVRAQGARVIIGDATHPVILQQAGSRRARHVIAATGDDSRNLEVAEQVRARSIRNGSERQTTIHVAIADQELWTELGRLHIGRVETGVVLEVYNRIDRVAQALLNESERVSGPKVFQSVVLEADGPLGKRLLVHLARRAAMSGLRPKVHVSQPTAESVVEPLVDREPWIRLSADVVVEARSTEASAAPVAFVCLTGSDAAAMARGLALAKLPTREAVYVAVQGQQTDALLEAAGTRGTVHLVPVDFRAMSDEFLHHSGHELMARVRHEEYVAQELSKGVTPDQNSSLVGWGDLPESLKESNRRFAETIGEAIHALGGRLVPLRQLEAEQTLFQSGDVLERLAMKEHDRWMAALRSDGWGYSLGPKDPAQKTHPLLVPWSELPEGEKEKDRDAMRAIPRMLARVGFAIEVHDASNKELSTHQVQGLTDRNTGGASGSFRAFMIG
jgi:voltage-gated potassium channel Kch